MEVKKADKNNDNELRDFLIGLTIMALVILGAYWIGNMSHDTSQPVTESCNTNGDAGGLGC